MGATIAVRRMGSQIGVASKTAQSLPQRARKGTEVRPNLAELIFEIGGVASCELLLVFGKVFDGKNRFRRANGHTSAAVDALNGVDKKLSGGFEAGFILLGMNAISGTHIDAQGVLNASVGNYVGHGETLPDKFAFRSYRSSV
jgi:hypothetical protein